MVKCLTIEELGALHVAAIAPDGVEQCLIDAARSFAEVADMEGLEFGPTFADTLAMNQARVDVIIP